MNSNGITMMVETGDDMRAIGERLSKLTHGGAVSYTHLTLPTIA